MSAITKLAGIATLFVQIPIWYYLIYKILVSVNATELMWFLFWVYIPVGIFTAVVAKLVSKA